MWCGYIMFTALLPPLVIQHQLLKHTRLNVVAFLNELPKTQHHLPSMTVDVNIWTVSSCLFCWRVFFNFKSFSLSCKLLLPSQNTLLAFTVSGIFKQGELCSSRLFEFLQHSAELIVVLCGLFFSVAVDAKSRESTVAFSRMFITVPAENTG